MSKQRLLKSIQFFRNSFIILEYFIFLHEFYVNSSWSTSSFYTSFMLIPGLYLFGKSGFTIFQNNLSLTKEGFSLFKNFSNSILKSLLQYLFFFFFLFFVCSQRLVRSFYETNIFHYVDLLVMAFRIDLRHIWGMISPRRFFFNPLSAIITKWSNTLKQFVGKLATNCLSVFDHFVGFALKGLMVRVYLIHLKTFD